MIPKFDSMKGKKGLCFHADWSVSLKLPERLETIISMVPKCGTVADIGCDHAYVSIALVERGIAEHAIACDINAGPLKHA